MLSRKNNIRKKQSKKKLRKQVIKHKKSKYQKGGAAAAAAPNSANEELLDFNNSATVRAYRDGPNVPIDISKLENQQVDRLPNGIFSALHNKCINLLKNKDTKGVELLLLRFYLQELLPKGKSAEKYLNRYTDFVESDFFKEKKGTIDKSNLSLLYNGDEKGLNKDKDIETACWFKTIPNTTFLVDYINLGKNGQEQSLFTRFKYDYLFLDTDDRLKKFFLMESQKYKMIYKIERHILFEIIVEKYNYLGSNAIKFNINIPEDYQGSQKSHILFNFFLNKEIYNKYSKTFNNYIEKGHPVFLPYLFETYRDLMKIYGELEAEFSFKETERMYESTA